MADGQQVEVITVAAPHPHPAYPVFIDAGSGAEERFAAALLQTLPQLRKGAALALLSDENVARLHVPRYREALERLGLRILLLVMPGGEENKNLSQIERLSSLLCASGIDRRAVVLALGGGIVSDMAGFVASMLLRGVPWAVCPTTLLSQADASIGGKTGVNLKEGKNLVGAFHFPRLIYADLSTLRTLPDRERCAGLGEVVKHALLHGDAALHLLEQQAEAARAGEPDLLKALLGHSARYKAQVVAADPEELDPGGGRALLNLGHTVGHALETATLLSPEIGPAGLGALRHGEAVALGLLASARVGAALLLGPPDLEDRLRRLLPRLGLPVDLDHLLFGPDGEVRDIVRRTMGLDKKRDGDEIRYVVVIRPGEVRLISLQVPRILVLLRPSAGSRP